jgi:thioredoxin 1
MLQPVLDELETEFSSVKFLKVDTDESPDLAGRFAIMGIPVVMVFKDGEFQDRVVGMFPKGKYEDMLNNHM